MAAVERWVSRSVWQSRLEAGKVGLGGRELLLGLVEQLPRLRVVQLEHDRLWSDRGAGPENDALDPALGGGGNPAPGFVHRDQRSEPAYLTQHRPALDGVDPHGGALDRWSRGLQAREDDRDEPDHEQPRDSEGHLLELLLPSDGSWSLNIHERIDLLDEMNGLVWMADACGLPLFYLITSRASTAFLRQHTATTRFSGCDVPPTATRSVRKWDCRHRRWDGRG